MGQRWQWRWRWRGKLSHWKMLRKWNDIVPTYIEVTKKICATFPMLNFSRWTPTLEVYFKWDSQKVLKIAHIGIFRHIGGVRWDRKITDIKILWVKVLHAKNGDFSTTRGWEINFFRQNIAMFDWLCTETYSSNSWLQSWWLESLKNVATVFLDCKFKT